MTTILPTEPPRGTGLTRPAVPGPEAARHIGWMPAYGRWHRQWRERRADLMETAAIASVVGVVAAFLIRGVPRTCRPPARC